MHTKTEQFPSPGDVIVHVALCIPKKLSLMPTQPLIMVQGIWLGLGQKLRPLPYIKLANNEDSNETVQMKSLVAFILSSNFLRYVSVVTNRRFPTNFRNIKKIPLCVISGI